MFKCRRKKQNEGNGFGNPEIFGKSFNSPFRTNIEISKKEITEMQRIFAKKMRLGIRSGFDLKNTKEEAIASICILWNINVPKRIEEKLLKDKELREAGVETIELSITDKEIQEYLTDIKMVYNNAKHCTETKSDDNEYDSNGTSIDSTEPYVIDEVQPHKLKYIKNIRKLTQEEIDIMQKRSEETERLGITMGWDIDLTIEEEIALLFVNEGKPVPQEVEMKMLEMKRLKETEGKDYFETTSMTFEDYIKYSNQLYQYIDIELDYTLIKN